MRSLQGHLEKMKSVLAGHTCIVQGWDTGMNENREVRKQWSVRSMAGVGRGSEAATGVLVQRWEHPVELLLGKKRDTGKDMKIVS